MQSYAVDFPKGTLKPFDFAKVSKKKKKEFFQSDFYTKKEDSRYNC